MFDKLGATEDQLDFPVIYASALNGYAGTTDNVEELKKIGNMRAIFDAVIKLRSGSATTIPTVR